MEELEHFVETLRADVEARCNCPVHRNKEVFKNGSYHLRKPQALGKGVFAYIRWIIQGRVVPDRCFEIEVKEKYAIKAGVAHFDRRNDNGCHNEPARYWWVLEGSHQTYNRAVAALSKICQVR